MVSRRRTGAAAASSSSAKVKSPQRPAKDGSQTTMTVVPGGSYLDSIPHGKKQRIMELAREIRTYSDQGTGAFKLSSGTGSGGLAHPGLLTIGGSSSSSSARADRVKPGGSTSSAGAGGGQSTAPDVPAFLSSLEADETINQLERQLAAANARVIEQEEQVLALLEAKRQDAVTNESHVKQLQEKLHLMTKDNRQMGLEMDSAVREQEQARKAQEKHRRQLRIEWGHGEELRGLLVEMLEQAEFWKARAGDGALWKRRLEKVLKGISESGAAGRRGGGSGPAVENSLLDDDVEPIDAADLVVEEGRELDLGGQVAANAGATQLLRTATTQGSFGGGSRERTGDTAVRKKYEAEIQRLQNQVEKLQKQEKQRQAAKQQGGNQSANPEANSKTLLDLCRKIKALQEQNAQLRKKVSKDTDYIKLLERKLLTSAASRGALGYGGKGGGRGPSSARNAGTALAPATLSPESSSRIMNMNLRSGGSGFSSVGGGTDPLDFSYLGSGGRGAAGPAPVPSDEGTRVLDVQRITIESVPHHRADTAPHRLETSVEESTILCAFGSSGHDLVEEGAGMHYVPPPKEVEADAAAGRAEGSLPDQPSPVVLETAGVVPAPTSGAAAVITGTGITGGREGPAATAASSSTRPRRRFRTTQPQPSSSSIGAASSVSPSPAAGISFTDPQQAVHSDQGIMTTANGGFATPDDYGAQQLQLPFSTPLETVPPPAAAPHLEFMQIHQDSSTVGSSHNSSSVAAQQDLHPHLSIGEHHNNVIASGVSDERGGAEVDEPEDEFDLSVLEKFTSDCATSLLHASPGPSKKSNK